MAATLAVLFRQMDAKAQAERELTDARQRRGSAAARARTQELADSAAHREARSAARLKDEFLMTVSHELRTPLTSIFGWAQMLATGELDARADSTRRSSAIERNARAQTRLIDDLLDVSRIDQRQAAARVRPVDLPTCCAKRSRRSGRRPTPRRSARDAIVDPDVGTIDGDPDRLQQVVWNLLSNAIKFTPAAAECERAAMRDATIELVVTRHRRRHRAGVPAARVRALPAGEDAGTTRRHGGLGLGLAIVRHLVELHGGSVHAESDGAGPRRDVPRPPARQTGN